MCRTANSFRAGSLGRRTARYKCSDCLCPWEDTLAELCGRKLNTLGRWNQFNFTVHTELTHSSSFMRNLWTCAKRHRCQRLLKTLNLIRPNHSCCLVRCTMPLQLTSNIELTGSTPVAPSSQPYNGVNTTFPFDRPPPLLPPAFFSLVPPLPPFDELPSTAPPLVRGAEAVYAATPAAGDCCSPAGTPISSLIAAIATSTTFEAGTERVRAHSSSLESAHWRSFSGALPGTAAAAVAPGWFMMRFDRCWASLAASRGCAIVLFVSIVPSDVGCCRYRLSAGLCTYPC